MGYPMTWQRVVNRNSLNIGIGWAPQVNVSAADDHSVAVSRVRRERITRYEEQAKLLFDDLERLQRDALDEKVIAARISSMTSVSADDVAAVLKEFFSL